MTTIPFTAVDELGCHFDSAHEPNNVHLEVAVDGPLGPDRLLDAITATLADRPMARVHRMPWRGRDRRFHWRIADRPDQVVVETLSWSTEPELAARRESFLAAAPPLDAAPALRFGHFTGPSGDVLVLNAHHAAFDGLSCLHLLRDIARHYAAPLADPSPTTANPVTAQRIPATAHPPPTDSPDTPTAQPPPSAPTRTPAADAQPDRNRRALRPPARIAADHDPDEPTPGYGFHLVSLTCQAGSGTEPGTVNDVLITALAIAVLRWNAEHDRAATPIRITMPINARGPAESDAIGNLSRLAVITADGGHPPGGLLADVARQTLAAKRVSGPQVDAATRLLATPHLPLAVKSRLVGAVRRLVAPWLTDTSLLSNLGRVAEPPDFGPDHPATALWFSTPAPLPRGLSVGVVSLRDKLLLCFRYRRALFGVAAAERFAGLFLAAVDSLGDPRLGR